MRLKLTMIVWLAAVLVGTLAPSVSAQYARYMGTSETGQSSFWVDHAVFRVDSTAGSRLEVYYKIFHFGLTFEEQAEKYYGSYELRVSIEDRDDQPVATEMIDKKIVLSEYSRTRSLVDYRSGQLNFELPAGKYRVLISLVDGHSKSIYKYDFSVKLKKRHAKKAALSSIELVQHTESSVATGSVFRKGEMLVIPSVSRDYGGDENSRLLFYIEVYRPLADSTRLMMETILTDPAGRKVYRDTLLMPEGKGFHRQLRGISTAEYAPGEYTIEAILRGRRNKKIVSQRESFIILWSQNSLLRHNYDQAMKQLELLALSGELDGMKKLEDFSERAAAFEQFWRERDPTPETDKNEVKNEFYRRISYSDANFRHMRQSGWSTDRGRIYVKYGEPDEVDDVPMSAANMPYQIWHYYEKGRYLRFTFLDEDLDGDYRLQFPYDGRGHRPDF